MPDPNARRDKSLALIAAELKLMNMHLAKLVEQGAAKVINLTLKPDAFDVPQEPQPQPEPRKDEKPAGPVFPKSDNPYFEQRTPDEQENNRRAEGIGYS